jgi:uncharacterized protein (UPF0332 family)
MSVNETDLIGLAQELSAGESEVAWRQSASCAYYAVFHRANSLCAERLPGSHWRMGEHNKLTERLKQCGPRGARLAYDISKLKYWRVLADYDIDEQFTQKSARIQLKNAKQVLVKTARFVDEFASLKRMELPPKRVRTGPR